MSLYEVEAQKLLRAFEVSLGKTKRLKFETKFKVRLNQKYEER